MACQLVCEADPWWCRSSVEVNSHKSWIFESESRPLSQPPSQLQHATATASWSQAVGPQDTILTGTVTIYDHRR